MPKLASKPINWSHGTIGVQAEKREGRCARRTKARRGRQCFGEQGGGPSTPRRAGILARALAQRPQSSSMAVFRALGFEPRAVKAYEIAKPSCVGIPRMLHKGGKAGRQNFREGVFAGFIERA